MTIKLKTFCKQQQKYSNYPVQKYVLKAPAKQSHIFVQQGVWHTERLVAKRANNV